MPTKEPKDIMVSQMVHGTIQSTIMGMYVGAVTSAPVIPADVDATGAVVLYLGTTDDTFENGRFYRFGDGAWSEAPVGATFDLTPGKVVVSDAEGNLVTSDLDSTALGNLTGLTGNVQTQIDAVESDVSSQGTRLTTAEGEIDTLQGTVSSQGTAISTAEGEIDTLQGQMNTANGNISSLQTTVAGKQDAITGGATTILTQNLGASKALISDASGKVAISNVSTTELGYVAGVTSAIQTQLDNLSSQISAMGGFAVQVVEELPGTGQPNTIYFVPSDSGADQNIKDEFMWLNGAWEQIGSTQFSLNITQNASGITINGTALQTATTARAGIMTPTEVLAIDTLNTNLGLAEDNIETLQTQMGTANSNISTLQSQMAQKVDNNDLATTSSSGLMSASDKTKLNGIAAGANKYVLPVAGTAIGGVKNGGNVVIDSSGNASVNLSGYATTSALNAKADQTTVTELSNNLSTLDSRTLDSRISALALSETGDNSISMNGSSVDAVRSVSGEIDESGNLVITVNGVSGVGIPLPDKESEYRVLNGSTFYLSMTEVETDYGTMPDYPITGYAITPTPVLSKNSILASELGGVKGGRESPISVIIATKITYNRAPSSLFSRYREFKVLDLNNSASSPNLMNTLNITEDGKYQMLGTVARGADMSYLDRPILTLNPLIISLSVSEGVGTFRITGTTDGSLTLKIASEDNFTRSSQVLIFENTVKKL